jgi:tetratricopeptide (TPR) repeat protein
MALTYLTYTFIAGGVVAILYAILALLSMIDHGRRQKALPDKYEPGPDMPATIGPPVADAYWGRAKILLQNGRFDDARADCKRTLEINPNHADAKSLLKHLVPPEPVSIVPTGALPLAAEVEKASHIDKKVAHEPEPKQDERSAPVEPASKLGNT